jgi:hypothetical protein
MQLFIEQLLNGLAAGSMYALITLGLALIYGVMKILQHFFYLLKLYKCKKYNNTTPCFDFMFQLHCFLS